MASFSQLDVAAEVLAQASAGDPLAQEHIYRTFEAAVATLTRRLVPRRAVAEELAQDVFVEVLGRLHQFDHRGPFAGWVRTITVNLCFMHLRSPWQRGRRWLNALALGDGDECAGLPAVPVAHDDRIDLERALAELGDTARYVVWLHDVEGYTHAEIGALLGGTASLSKSQLARAHLRLRALLEDRNPPGACLRVTMP